MFPKLVHDVIGESFFLLFHNEEQKEEGGKHEVDKLLGVMVLFQVMTEVAYDERRLFGPLLKVVELQVIKVDEDHLEKSKYGHHEQHEDVAVDVRMKKEVEQLLAFRLDEFADGAHDNAGLFLFVNGLVRAIGRLLNWLRGLTKLFVNLEQLLELNAHETNQVLGRFGLNKNVDEEENNDQYGYDCLDCFGVDFWFI